MKFSAATATPVTNSNIFYRNSYFQCKVLMEESNLFRSKVYLAVGIAKKCSCNMIITKNS